MTRKSDSSNSTPAKTPCGKAVNRIVASTVTLQGTALASASPLHWWRLVPAPAFQRINIIDLRRVIMGTAIIGEHRWADAARGDAAAAIAVAIRTIERHEPEAIPVDLAMSAVLCCALERNAAAALLLALVLQRRAATDKCCAVVTRTWQTAHSRIPGLAAPGKLDPEKLK